MSDARKGLFHALSVWLSFLVQLFWTSGGHPRRRTAATWRHWRLGNSDVNGRTGDRATDQSECTSTLNEFFFRNKAIYYFGDRGGDVDDTAASAAATRQTGRNVSFRRRARPPPPPPPPVSPFSSPPAAHEFVIGKTSTSARPFTRRTGVPKVVTVIPFYSEVLT